MKCLLDIIWGSTGILDDAIDSVQDGYPGTGRLAISHVMRDLAEWRNSLGRILSNPDEVTALGELRRALTGKPEGNQQSKKS